MNVPVARGANPKALWVPHLALHRPAPSEGSYDWEVVTDGPCPWELKAACPTEESARAAMRLLSM